MEFKRVKTEKTTKITISGLQMECLNANKIANGVNKSWQLEKALEEYILKHRLLHLRNVMVEEDEKSQ